jgi:hypothetical protein
MAEKKGEIKTQTALQTTEHSLAEQATFEMEARSRAEIEAMIIVAQRFPRDVDKAWLKISKLCKRKRFAEDMLYEYPRGGGTVIGPSVKLARPLATLWGNIKSGFRILRDDGDQITLEGYAWDTETNVYSCPQATFANLIYRKGKGWIRPDERDKLELINRNAAKLVRNAILSIIPPDIVDDAIDLGKQTLASDIKDLEATRRNMISAFSNYGVTIEQLQAFIARRRGTGECDLSTMTADELASLKMTYNSIVDGNSKPADYFTNESIEEDAEKDKNTSLVKKLKKQNGDESNKDSAPDDLSDKSKAVRDRYNAMCGDAAYTDIPEVKAELAKLEGKDFSFHEQLTIILDNIEDLKVKHEMKQSGKKTK